MSSISVWWLMALLLGAFMALGWVGYWFFARPIPLAALAAPRERPPRLMLNKASALWCQAGQVAVVLRAGGWRPLAAVLLVVGVAVGTVSALGGMIRVDPRAALPGVFGVRIGQAFAPEQLVPPPALPPTLFASPDDPGLASADRDWAKLDAGFRQAVLWLIERARQRGVQLVLLEGYRSPERQEHLANQGPGVTRAGAFQSKHQFGLAVDLVPMRDGRLAMSEAEPWAAEAYRIIGEEAEQMGLVWGGRWTLRDLGHVEMAGAIVARRKS